MREIKFRAWIKGLEEMVEVDELRYFPNEDAHSLELGNIWYTRHNSLTRSMGSIEKVELMQFTGLKDRNGTEIYEGDILEVDCGLTKDSKWWKEPQTMVCKWAADYGGFMFCDPGQKAESRTFGGCLTLGSGNGHMYQRSTVIGNIYENPELLED